jgi:hypothetical protein
MPVDRLRDMARDDLPRVARIWLDSWRPPVSPPMPILPKPSFEKNSSRQAGVSGWPAPGPTSAVRGF